MMRPVGFQAIASQAVNLPAMGRGPATLQALPQDTIQFGYAGALESANKKLVTRATEILETANNGKPIEPGQKIYLTGSSDNLPFLRVLTEVAYRDFKSGPIYHNLTEPGLEALKLNMAFTKNLPIKRQ